MDKVALDQSFLGALWVSFVSIVPTTSIPFFVQNMGEVWEKRNTAS